MDDDFGDLSAREAPAPPPKVKRSLFTKKITAEVPATAEPVDFFSRAKDIYPQRRAEEERRRQKKLTKLERKRSSASLEVQEGSPSGEKRRKVSVQRDGYSSDENVVKKDFGMDEGRRDSERSSQDRERYQNRGTPTSLSARYTQELNTHRPESPKKNGIAKGYISLSDSESNDASGSEEETEKAPTTLPVRKTTTQSISVDDDDCDFSAPPRRVRHPPVEDEAEKSDEEFPELVAAAKERARTLAEQKLAAEAAFAAQNHGDLDSDDIFNAETSIADPVIDILITSKIQGSKPLTVKRKLHGRLREVRWAWCDKQVLEGEAMTAEMKESIFLTWKGNRLWDWSDCSACVDRGGKLSMNHVHGGKVHLEAWTADTFEAWKKGCEAKQREERELSEDEPVAKAAPVQRTRLVMKSRGFSDYKLQVRATTTIQEMINVFRGAKEIPDDKDISLHFDGDKLDVDDTIEDTELGDMDSVEVHVQ